MSNVDLDPLTKAEMETMERVSAVLGVPSTDVENLILSLAAKHFGGLVAGDMGDDELREAVSSMARGGQAITA